MNIGEAEKLTGIAKKNIRFYEEAGLLSVQRDERTGYRIFQAEDIRTLKEIKLYRNIGVPIQDIQAILNKTSSPTELLIKLVQELDNQINSLRLKKELLMSILDSNKLHNCSGLIYDMEDILFCDASNIQDRMVLMEKKDIILASMGASPQVNELLQELLPEINIQNEQKKIGRVKIEDIEKAQLKLILHMNSFV